MKAPNKQTMEQSKIIATTVAPELINVADNATSVNLNPEIMLEENKEMVAQTSNTASVFANETSNVANEATSVEQKQIDMTDEKTEVVRTTRIAIINGEERKIVVAHTEYGMELPKDRKKLIKSLDKGKMLSCLYHLAKPEIFWDEDIELLDEDNQPIEKGTKNVYVLCPMADSYWRVAVDEKLEKVEVHEFKNVQDYAQAVGCTNLYSRGMSDIEKMGIAALAMEDKNCKTLYMFAKKHKMNVTSAKLYLDCSVKSSTITEMSMGNVPKHLLTLGRTEENAEELLKVTTEKFGKDAIKRYAIRAINPLLRKEKYSMEQVLEAIKMVSEVEKIEFDTASSEEKQSVISDALIEHLQEIKRKEAA